MATRYATKNGNWSDVTVWDGGTTLPGTADDVYSNTFTVTIDQDITVASLRSVATTGVTTGGLFQASLPRDYIITITSGLNGIQNGQNNTGILTVAGPAQTVNLYSNLSGSTGTGRRPVAVSASYSGHLIVHGNIIGGTSSSGYGMYHSGVGGTLTLNGTVTGGSTTDGVYTDGQYLTVIVNGTLTGGLGGHGLQVLGANAFVTTNNTITGSSGGSYAGLYMNSSVGTAIINGTTIGGGPQSGVLLGSSSVVKIRGPLVFGSSGMAPVDTAASTSTLVIEKGNEDITLQVSSDDNWPVNTGAPIVLELYPSDQPEPEDVVAGHTYGPNGQNVGTMGAPLPGQVAAGVPVGETVGTATYNPADVAAIVAAQLEAALNED